MTSEALLHMVDTSIEYEFDLKIRFANLAGDGPHGVPGAVVTILNDVAHEIAAGRYYSPIVDNVTDQQIGHWVISVKEPKQ